MASSYIHPSLTPLGPYSLDPRFALTSSTTTTTHISSDRGASGSAEASSSSVSSSSDYVANPFTKINNRSYFRDPENPYPLPCDLPEIHRQSLRTMTLMRVFGAPSCAPQLEGKSPKRVLELACGSGLWSSACHDYLARRGQKDTTFIGLDIISLAPNLRKKGVNWQFVRHDLRKPSLPFPSEHFDFVFIKDASLCQSATAQQIDLLSEPLRVLKHGGVLEVWDSDYVFRALLPNPTPPPKLAEKDQDQAYTTATYTISSATPFAAAQNKYLLDYNSWVEKAFEKHKLSAMPCATIGLSFTAEADAFQRVGSRRIAIPLGAEVRWEQTKKQRKLTADQLSLRQMALLTIIQMIEGMEPILKEASGKSQDEWDRWWAAMTVDLLQKNGLANGECLEVGAWWGQKG
ncbi:SAM binding motif-containing protein [Talaromyces proteolyticus]|uniref:SAM binding motif-containing protein n=1 Tax=Talaromyces proteolyticus TaxID=1131652 RepID=A0AAD4KPZ0_9EURO|nr:SAM binding motif-containing protein [Talaromyces proteolyticus]KAH8697747.1 SAM binding motif-containing protein [Talaromyces proteolyticus]